MNDLEALCVAVDADLIQRLMPGDGCKPDPLAGASDKLCACVLATVAFVAVVLAL